MKKSIFSLLTIVALMTIAVGCSKKTEPDAPAKTNDSIPAEKTDTTINKDTTDTTIIIPEVKSFPRKQMIEHFTGQTCGYCPDAMDAISSVLKANPDKYVWLSNHAGFADDSFTITESKKIVSKFGVNFAPAMMLNRTKCSYSDSDGKHNDLVFHPGYLPSIVKSQITETAPLSVEIATEMSGNQLAIKVDGEVSDTTEQLLLIVAVKESGLHGPQSDYYNTWEGWEDYIHSNVVRKYVSNYLGDTVKLSGYNYTQEYTLDWNTAWNAENSSVVAYIVGPKGNVVNANQAPVIEGTAGGNDIDHEGVKRVEVPETYPEDGDTPAGGQNVTFAKAEFSYAGKFSNGNKVLLLDLSTDKLVKYDSNPCLIYVRLFVVLNSSASTNTLPNGTYSFSDDMTPGTVWAGYKDEASYSMGGSSLYYAQVSYLQTYGYVIGAQWLLTAGGTLTIADGSITYETTNLHGTTMKGSFFGVATYTTAPMQKRQSTNVPFAPKAEKFEVCK